MNPDKKRAWNLSTSRKIEILPRFGHRSDMSGLNVENLSKGYDTLGFSASRFVITGEKDLRNHDTVLLIIEDGSGELHSNLTTFNPINAGDIILLPPQTLHKIFPADPKKGITFLSFYSPPFFPRKRKKPENLSAATILTRDRLATIVPYIVNGPTSLSFAVFSTSNENPFIIAASETPGALYVTQGEINLFGHSTTSEGRTTLIKPGGEITAFLPAKGTDSATGIYVSSTPIFTT